MTPLKKLAVLAGVSLSAISVSAPAQANETEATAESNGPELGTFGFDTTGMDRSTNAGENFYAFANGEWAKRTEIPADKSNYGMFTKLDDCRRSG